MLDEVTVAAYLDRISAFPPRNLDECTLRHLQERHVLSVPFENIDYHSGHEIFMDERIIGKVVGERRGGGCYEINTAFYLLLSSLGFRVTLHQCRVWIAGRFSAPYNHVVMVVEVSDVRWFVDVGFGKNSRFPLSLETDGPQQDPHGTFHVRRVDAERATDVLRNQKLQYRFYDKTVDLGDFSQHLWWYRTCPDSPFLKNQFCSLPTENGRVTLTGDKLTVIDGQEQRTEHLGDSAAVLDAYDQWFGIKLAERPVPSRHLDNSMRMSFFAQE